MGNTAAISLLVVTCVCFVISLAFLIAGTVGHEWWKGKSGLPAVNGLKVGLWEVDCSDLLELASSLAGVSMCKDRPEVLRFDSDVLLSYPALRTKSEELDIILALLIVSGGFVVVSVILTFCMFCCLKAPGLWRCTAIGLALNGIVGAGCGHAAVIFAEVEFEDAWDTWYDHGWSIILAWIGAAMMFVASVLAFILMCVAPEPRVKQTTMRQAAYSNEGFERNTIPMMDNYAPRYKY